MIALLNAVVGALLGALVDNRLGAWAQLLTHDCQSRQPGQRQSVTAQSN
jgi:membrane protein YqaA with SNARE-associated domain